jgi:DNA-binding beta-propeller fold protein YncE
VTTRKENVSRYIADRERKSRVRRIVALILLVLLLALITWSAMYYSANRRFAIPFITTSQTEIEPPQYLYSINGPEGTENLRQPIGLCVTGDDVVYVVDGEKDLIRSYTTDGDYRFSFSAIESDDATALAQPARVAESPAGELWVTDRLLRGIFVFSKDGTFIREFVPEGDAADSWAPISVSFDDVGRVYVADVGISKEHRVLIFNTDGQELARFGRTARIQQMQEQPGDFYFPNGVAIAKTGDIYVSDGNNRRVQIFGSDGAYKQIIPTSGTPRGIAIDKDQRVYVVDALAHTVDVYELTGKRVIGFGQPGVGLGQFRFPSDIAFDRLGRIFVTDRENHQIQVWGWPTGVVPPVVTPETPTEWAICLSPLLLLPLLLLRRRRTFVVTEDFIDGMETAGEIPAMDDRRFRWVVPQADLPKYAGRSVAGVALDDLIIGEAHSESDVNDLVAKTGIDRETAVVLTMAGRAGRLATEQQELREFAEPLGVAVYNRASFLEEFSGRKVR